MADARLFRQLSVVVDQLRKLRSLRNGTVGWLILTAVLGVLLLLSVDRVIFFSLFAVGAVVVFVWSHVSLRPQPSDEQTAALLLEKRFPDLDARLLTAVDQNPNQETWQFGYLQSRVISEVVEHSRTHPWQQAIPRSHTLTASAVNMLAMLSCLALAVLVVFRPPVIPSPPLTGADTAVETPTGQIVVSIDPGDVNVERGTSLLVTARFPADQPHQVELVAIDEQQQRQRIPLARSLDDPLFGGRIASVERDLKYHVEYDGQKSAEFVVTTFEYPELMKADAQIEFPVYTGLEPKTIEDTRQLTVVEGSQLQLDCVLNKPVRSATLIDEEGERLELTPLQDDNRTVSLKWIPPSGTQMKYLLELVDADGRRNRHPDEFTILVQPNQLPDLKVVFPARDTRVSLLEEVSLEASVADDFGLVEYGLIYQTPDGHETQIPLGETAAREERQSLEHLLPLETLHVEPDQLVSYYFYADDIGPDGTQRRSFSDMFFAEVRPFEEIYRQAPPQQGQGQGQPSPGQKLVELQRQIVTAAWNILRRERDDPPGALFPDDMRTLVESQDEVRNQAGELVDRLTDPLMQEEIATAVESMAAASTAFADALSKNSRSPLQDGRSAAQEAYQALLRLNSREKQIMQSQSQSQSSSASQQRMDRQLHDLELKNDRNRYQSERQAQQQQNTRRETLQVLNRLRELARRQEDLNDKIRELQNKLRNAETDDQKRELERQLKRLQEEQQELLRNLDELRQRMSQEQNRERMADAREQVDQTRERVLRSADALRQQQTSRALTEGTRAQRQLEQLQQEFRRQSAGEFDETLRQLRSDARNLAQQQSDLAQKMRQDNSKEPSQRPSLRNDTSDHREEITKALQDQKQQLTDVLDRTRKLVEESEASEPLLSKRLYDTMRDLRKYEPEEALQAATQLTKYGIAQEAQRAEKQARQGINRLQTGVEEAAESILGDESEALRQAQGELQQLTEAIRDELAHNDQQPQDQQSSMSEQAGPPQGEPSEKQNGRQPGSEPADSRTPPQQASPKQPGAPGDPTPTGKQPQQPSQQASSSQSPQQPAADRPSQQPSAEQSGNSASSSSSGKQGGTEQQGSQSKGSQQPATSPGSQLGALFQQSGETANGGGTAGPHMPLTGGEFRQWSDRMRDIEEMMTSPELRAQVAMIRDRARQIRVEVRRHSKQPNWELVRSEIYGPMLELQNLIAEELARKAPQKSLVPIDRDPVPDKYADFVKKYYEQLSRQSPTGEP